MNWVDVIVILIFLVYIAEGLRRGFIEQLFELFGFILTLFVGFWIYQPVADWLVRNVGVQQLAANPLAFLLVWVVLQLIFSLIVKMLHPLIPEKIRLAITNRIAGILPSGAKAFIVLSILLTIVTILQVPQKLRAAVNDSLIGNRLVLNTSQVESFLQKVFGRDLKDGLTFLTVPAQNEEIIAPNERVNLNFTTDDITIDTVSEQEMLSFVNEERRRIGLGELVWDEDAAKVARAHSMDMFRRGYFSHENLEGLSPFDRMERAGLTYTTAGENLAFAASAELAHAGLMRSPGHRQNLLSKDFGRVGIGVIDGGIYGKMFTQNFRN